MEYPVSAVMVTAPSRAQVKDATVHHLVSEIGLRHIRFAWNQPDEPESHTMHGVLSQRVIAAALDSRPDLPVLFLEDDIRMDPAARHWLRFLANTAEQLGPITLYLPDAGDSDHVIRGRDFYPKVVVDWFNEEDDDDPVPPLLFPVRRLDRWWGSQALLLPAGLCRALLSMNWGHDPLDRALRTYLLETRQALYSVCPNLVQHEGLPSVSSPPAPIHRSLTFGRAS